MKVLFRILIIATCIGIIIYYSNEESSQTELLEGPPSITKPVVEPEHSMPAEQYLPRPATGISTLIGKTSKEVLETYSTPKRIDPAEYGYEWWIYDTDNGLLMISMKEDRVNQIYTNNSKFDIAPFVIGEPLDDIYRTTVLGQEITVELGENIYIFAMNEQDLHDRILVKYDNLYAQLYIDQETNRLYSVRFLDGETLVLHKPYEMQFIGELFEASTPSSYMQIDINLANRRQLTDLANSLRVQYGLPALLPSDTLASLADYNSEHMFLGMMDSQVTDDEYKIEDQLNEVQQGYEQHGVNVATNYKDAIEVIHGWMNSKEHRTLLTDEEFTHIGSGAFMNYYTQLYVKQKQK
ncbi:CAP domain-containing protein [Solibacillus isronensis]|uniref:CAP domain-containing protein n=1 Tax=Solibacillus isronensis TaxID=412383 RepID=UPI0039A178D3